MTDLQLTLTILIFPLLGYLIGSLMFAIIYGKIFKADPRTYGSKNPGATNVTRKKGLLIGSIVAFSDASKSIISVVICYFIANAVEIKESRMFVIYVSGIAAVLGHWKPIFFGFKGGKGVSVSGGLLLIINPLHGTIVFAIWISLMLITAYVSVSSMLALLTSPGFIWIEALNIETLINLELFETKLFISLLLLANALFIIYLHRANIIRLILKTEVKAKTIQKIRSKFKKKGATAPSSSPS